VVDPHRDSPAGRIQERTGRLPRYVFDCAGTPTSFQEAVDLADHHGIVMALGVSMTGASLFPVSWFLKELRLAFSFGYSYAEFGSSLDLLARGAADAGVVVSDLVPLSGINEAFTGLRGPGHSKILVDCQDV
jgi:threonine dehydrogenase-like Zn-dependent dehydrogenase